MTASYGVTVADV